MSQELERKEADIEKIVAGFSTSLVDISKAFLYNTGINKEINRLLKDFVSSKTQLLKTIFEVKLQVKAVLRLEVAINKLDEYIPKDTVSDLQGKMKTGVSYCY